MKDEWMEKAKRAAYSDMAASDLAKRMNAGMSAQEAVRLLLNEAVPEAIVARDAAAEADGFKLVGREAEYPLLTLATLCDAIETDGPRGTWVTSELDDYAHEYSISSMREKRTVELTDDFEVLVVINEYPGGNAPHPLKMCDLRIARNVIGDRREQLLREAREWYANQPSDAAPKGGGHG